MQRQFTFHVAEMHQKRHQHHSTPGTEKAAYQPGCTAGNQKTNILPHKNHLSSKMHGRGAIYALAVSRRTDQGLYYIAGHH